MLGWRPPHVGTRFQGTSFSPPVLGRWAWGQGAGARAQPGGANQSAQCPPGTLSSPRAGRRATVAESNRLVFHPSVKMWGHLKPESEGCGPASSSLSLLLVGELCEQCESEQRGAGLHPQGWEKIELCSSPAGAPCLTALGWCLTTDGQVLRSVLF